MTTAGDRLVAFARSPRELVASWVLSPATWVRALRTLGARAEGAAPALRVSSTHGASEHRLDLGASGVTIPMEPDASEVLVEVGLATTGGFAPLLASDFLTIPAEGPSYRRDVTWVSATAPRLAIPHDWSGQRAPVATARLDGPRSSDLSSR